MRAPGRVGSWRLRGKSADGQDQLFKMVQRWDKANKELGKRKSFSLGVFFFD